MVRRGRKTKETFMVQEDNCVKISKVFEFQYYHDMEPQAGWDPNMDIFETEEDLIILIEAAGLQEDTLQLHAIENRLVVSGERILDFRDKITHYHQLEIQFMPFQKTIILPAAIDPDIVKANYKNGMLYIRVSKEYFK